MRGEQLIDDRVNPIFVAGRPMPEAVKGALLASHVLDLQHPCHDLDQLRIEGNRASGEAIPPHEAYGVERVRLRRQMRHGLSAADRKAIAVEDLDGPDATVPSLMVD